MLRPKPNTRLACTAMLVVGYLAGCSNVKYSSSQQARYFKPTLAVVTFETSARDEGRWDLGQGFADELIDRLINTNRYTVMERQQLNSSIKERKTQDDTWFSRPAKGEKRPLRQTRYLVKGTVTDFGAAPKDNSLITGKILGGNKEAVLVAVKLRVIDLQTGEIIANETLESKVRGDNLALNTPGSAAFGSQIFYHSPYGRATADVLDQAVRIVTHAIDERPYQPKIASVLSQSIIVNGGRDRNMAVGSEYIVRPAPQNVVDPDTGQVLGHIAGATIGRVRITQVTEKYSIAAVITGSGFAPGQTLFPSATTASANPAETSSY